MNNFGASVVYGTLALALMGTRFYMDGDDVGVVIVAVVAMMAWASCYMTAIYEQIGGRIYAIGGLALTGWAVVIAILAFVRMVWPW